MRFKKSSIPSGEQIEKLALSAARGDADALNELGALNEKIGRRANQNIRDLEKKGYKESDAYKQAAFATGKDKPRFSQSGKPGFGEDAAAAAYRLAESAKQSAKFLRYKTSTVGGVREKAAKGSEKMKAKLKAAFSGVVDDIDKKWKKVEKDLNKFLSSDAFGEIKNTMGSPVIEAVAEKISEGADINELLNLYKLWEDGTIDVGILTVWDTWEKMT